MKLSVAGAGYMGLSNAVLLAHYNGVVLYDTNKGKLNRINGKRSSIKSFFKGCLTHVNRERVGINKGLNMVEQFSSGLPRILARFSQRSFDFIDFFLKVTFQSQLGNIAGSITLTRRQQEIINLIKQDYKISYRAMAQELSINELAIIKHLNTLKKQNIITKEGGTRGYWSIKL